MCGRFYVDDDLADEVEEMFPAARRSGVRKASAHDVVPSQETPVLMRDPDSAAGRQEPSGLLFTPRVFGFRGYQGKSLLINARAETAAQKPAFRDSLRHSRCVIPVSAFYEFSPDKEKVEFRLGKGVFFLAGCVRDDRFVILTTAPNASVSPVHNRMPVIVSREDVCEWILSPDVPGRLLTREMPPLSVHREYEQLSFDLPMN